MYLLNFEKISHSRCILFVSLNVLCLSDTFGLASGISLHCLPLVHVSLMIANCHRCSHQSEGFGNKSNVLLSCIVVSHGNLGPCGLLGHPVLWHLIGCIRKMCATIIMIKSTIAIFTH
jgi:hypothetical protein